MNHNKPHLGIDRNHSNIVWVPCLSITLRLWEQNNPPRAGGTGHSWGGTPQKDIFLSMMSCFHWYKSSINSRGQKNKKRFLKKGNCKLKKRSHPGILSWSLFVTVNWLKSTEHTPSRYLGAEARGSAACGGRAAGSMASGGGACVEEGAPLLEALVELSVADRWPLGTE